MYIYCRSNNIDAKYDLYKISTNSTLLRNSSGVFSNSHPKFLDLVRLIISEVLTCCRTGPDSGLLTHFRDTKLPATLCQPLITVLTHESAPGESRREIYPFSLLTHAGKSPCEPFKSVPVFKQIRRRISSSASRSVVISESRPRSRRNQTKNFVLGLSNGGTVLDVWLAFIHILGKSTIFRQ